MNKNNFLKSFLISICIMMFMLSKSYAHLDTITFNNLNIEQGISQSTVNVIFQDSKGYIWLGTDDGLNKYNGYDYKIYNYEENKNTISNNIITDITEDNNENLWVSTLGGMNKIDLNTSKITNYTISNNGISNYNVTEVICTKDNKILVTTYDGLHLYDETYDRFHKILDKESGLLSDFLYAIDEDSNGNIWVGSEYGVNKISKDFKILKSYSYEKYNSSIGKSEVFTVYCDDKYDFVWAGTSSSGIFKINTTTDEIHQYSNDSSDETSLPSNDIGSIFRDKDDTLWIGTSNGLSHYEEDTDSFKTYNNKIYDKNSLVYDDVNTLMQDKEGVIWVGTYSGISIFETQSTIKHYKAGLDNDYLLKENMVHGIYESHNKYLWVGSKSKGVSIINREANTAQYINTQTVPIMKSDSINDITGYEDLIFIATQDGVLRVNTKTNEIFSYTIDDGLINNKVKDLFIDDKGYLWIGTVSGLSILNIETNEFVSLNNVYEDKRLYIRHIYQSSDNKYYLGLLEDKGLLVLDPKNNSAKIYKNEKNNDSSISSNRIRYINEDSKGNIWLGTSYGLNKFNPNTEKFTRYTAKDGLANNTIYGVLIDNFDNIWISSNRGISKVQEIDNKIKVQNFSVTNGLQSNEFNGNAAFQSNDCEFFFGGVNGLNSFCPNEVSTPDKNGKVIFDGFKVGNTFYNDINNLDFNHNIGSITINFFTPIYSSHKKVMYEYKLIGASEEISTTKYNTVTYNDLPPGDYTFEVKVIDTSGNISDKNNIKFTIKPPFWKTPLAYTIYLLGAMYFILRYKYRVKVLDGLVQKRTKKLETEMEKNIILLNKNIQLEKNKNSYFVNLSHELRTPLNVVTSTNQLILELLRKNDSLEKSKLAHYVNISQRNSKRLLNLINNIVDTSKLQDNMYVIDLEKTNIIYLVEETALSLADYIESKNIELIIDPEIEEKFIMCSPDEIERCIINLVGNAAKFTPEGGRITISIKDFSSHVMINVADTGCGIDKKYLDVIFNRFNQVVDANHEVKGGSGLGLTITKQLINLHKGRIFVHSEVGKGSTFTIILPVNPDLSDLDEPATCVTLEQI